MIEFLKKNSFDLDARAIDAFHTLKNTMITLPVLGLLDFTLPFDVKMDASSMVVGVVVSKKDQSIAFFSHKLSSQMQVASAYERYMFAITSTVQKWHHYLLGKHF